MAVEQNWRVFEFMARVVWVTIVFNCSSASESSWEHEPS